MLKQMQWMALSLLVAPLVLLPGLARSAPLVFDYVAHVDSSDRPGAPTGSTLTGKIVYDPDAVMRQVGENNYYMESGGAYLTARGSNGFFLQMNVPIIVVTAGDVSDTMTVQTFISESPNDWHMVLDLIEPGGDDGWLMGDSSLPTSFPSVLDNAFMSIYFTDEFDWVRTIDATLTSITPSQVPLPAAAWLFGSALLMLAGVKRRRTA